MGDYDLKIFKIVKIIVSDYNYRLKKLKPHVVAMDLFIYFKKNLND